MASGRAQIQGETKDKKPRPIRVDDKGRLERAPTEFEPSTKELLHEILDQMKITNAHHELITGETITIEEAT